MKDLFVFAADADAQALLRSILPRHKEIGIRPLTFTADRHTGRDSGMVKDGPEIARMKAKKTEYSHLILIWDHHGSGWDARTPESAANSIQRRLDGATWAEQSAAVVIVPELEEWLWHCPESIARCIGSSALEFDRFLNRAANELNMTIERCRIEKPKELFGKVIHQKQRRQPPIEIFERLGRSADLGHWASSPSFRRLVETLRFRVWFPAA